MTDEKKPKKIRTLSDVQATDATESIRRALEKSQTVSQTLQEAMVRADPLRDLKFSDSALSAFQAQHDALAKHARAFRAPIDQALGVRSQLKALAVSDAVAEIQAISVKREEAMRIALGPLRDIHQINVINPLKDILVESESFRSIAASAADAFRMPELNETSRMLAGLVSQSEQAFAGLTRYQDSIQAAMDSIQAPWLKYQDAMQSVTAFSSLHAMAAELDQQNPFNQSVVHQLRDNLGDWRASLELPTAIAESLVQRSEFYLDKGFNPDLTNFPNEVFETALDQGLLREPIPSIGVVEGENLDVPVGADNEGLDRTSWAQDRITLLELHVRNFITAQLRSSVGPKWVKQRVPGDMRKKWVEKRDKAVAAGEPERDIIHYADFSDYRILIERTDNWNDVFQPVFGRKDDIRESWQRLFPIRIATMHARLISQDDELLLVVETKRILKAIGVLR